jgi:hypothetical protein
VPRLTGHDDLFPGAERESQITHTTDNELVEQSVRVGTGVIWACVGSGIEHRRGSAMSAEPDAATDEHGGSDEQTTDRR